MLKPARVLSQVGGQGAVVFPGQSVPVAAIRAETLHRLHMNGRTAMQCAVANDYESPDFRDALQDLHEGLATLLLDLQVTACLLYTSPSPRDQRGSRMPSSA